jgi:ATP-dependent helicase/nuclease subunit A
VTSPEYEAWRPVDEQMAHDERIRLLYVACTRARDHLVVSLHRPERRSAHPDDGKLTSAEVLAEAAATVGLLDDLPDALSAGPAEPVPDPASGAPAPDREPAGAAPDGGPSTLPPFPEWRAARDESLAQSGRPRTVAATALAADGRPDTAEDPGLRKRPRDLDLPPWQKGRYGTAIGRAVHGTLQTIDLRTGAGAAEAVAAQAAAEGVMGLNRHVRSLVDAALRSPTILEAAAHPHWREVYVGVPLTGGRTLEGYIDLLYRRADGLVVVDYKTGPGGLTDDLDPLVERYRLQGASYALAAAEATGEDVAAMVFVFLTPEGPVDRSLVDLDDAIADARRLAEAGQEPVAALG